MSDTDKVPAAQPVSSPAEAGHARSVRELLAAARTGALATLSREPPGVPFASFVEVADDGRGEPLFLLSALAEHTKNLVERPAASLLVTQTPREAETPVSIARATFVGNVVRVEPGADRDAALARFLAVHPHAQQYAAFPDFALYRLRCQSIRYVGGFGRMSWVSLDAYRLA